MHGCGRRSGLRSWLVCVAGACSLAVGAAAQPPTLVADLELDPQNGDSVTIISGAAAGPRFVFASSITNYGAEPAVSDGTPGGTALLADICPGTCSSHPDRWTRLGNMTFFLADDGLLGREPWISDGTAAGTRRIRDICPGPCGSSRFFLSLPPAVVATDERVYFVADDGSHGPEIWSTDGTRTGTQLLVDLTPGVQGSSVLALSAGDDSLIALVEPGGLTSRALVAIDAESGFVSELISFDCVWCEPLGRANGLTFFTHFIPGFGRELWITDGTPTGTRMVKDLCPAGCDTVPSSLTTFGNAVYFVAKSHIGRDALYRSDGTAIGTEMVLGGGLSAHDDIEWLTPFAGALYFVAETSFNIDRLWRTDGTLAGTGALTTAGPQPGRISELVGAGPLLYFVRDGHRLWRSNGIPSGTVQVLSLQKEPFPTLRLPASGADFLLFAAIDEAAGTEPWSSHGTAVSTYLAADLSADPGSSQPAPLHTLGSSLLFGATAESLSDGPFVLDADGRLSRTGQGDARVHRFLELGERRLYSSLHQPGLFLTDGRTPGTSLVTPLPIGAEGFLRLPGDVYVFAAEDQAGREPWRTDLTEGGSHRIIDLDPGFGRAIPPLAANSSDPRELRRGPSGDALFVATSPEVGREWHRSDGSETGTEALIDLCPGVCSSSPSDVADWSGGFVFAAEEPDSGRELWWSDGIPGSAVLLADILPGPRSGSPHDLHLLGEQLVFAAAAPAGGEELWTARTDSAATAAAGAVVEPLASLGDDEQPSWVVASARAHDRVYLVVANEESGAELWVSDGTAANTTLVSDLSPGPGSAAPAPLLAIGRSLVFAASEPTSGREPWLSDGTAAGTKRVADLEEGDGSSSPQAAALVSGSLYFQAYRSDVGRELFSLPVSSLFDPAPRPERPIPADGEPAAPVDPQLQWQVPAGHYASPLRFRVLLGRAGEEPEVLCEGSELPSCSPGGLLPDTTYNWSVRVEDATGGVIEGPTWTFATAGALDVCAGPEFLCLHGGRFEVKVSWRAPDGIDGDGRRVVGAQSDDSGMFWFFREDNWEMLVKVLDGCSVNDRYWVFAAAATNVEYTLRVTDTLAGESRVFTNPQFRAAPALIDTSAFATCDR